MPKTIAKIGKALYNVTLKPLASLFGLKVPKQKTVQRPYKQSVSPRRSAFGRVKVGGPYALYEAVDKDSVDVVALLQGRSNAVLQAYLNDDKVDVNPVGGGVTCPEDDRKYGEDRVKLFTRLGLATETAYSEITAIYPTWDADHRGDTVTSLGLICRQAKGSKQNERFPNGLPEPSLVLEAQLIFDPRATGQDQGDPDTYAYSQNPALQLAAFLTDAEGGMGLDYDRVIAPRLASWVDAADDCDALEVTIDGTEPRYESHGAYDHDTAPGDVIKSILSTFDGMLDPAGDGSFVLHPGRYVAPTVTITDRMVKAYTLESCLVDEQAANLLLLRFTDPTADFNEGDAGELRDEDDIDARGKERPETLDLDWVQSQSQAVRLGKRSLARSVQPLRGTLTCNMMGLIALAERYLRLQIADHVALADVVVERTSAIRVDVGKQELSFAWIAAEATIDDGDPGAETPQPGPPDPRPQPDPLTAPTITDLTALYEDSASGVSGARIEIDVSSPLAADVEWLARWRPQGATDWVQDDYEDIADGAAVTLVTGFVQATGDVEVQVAYRTAGAVSPWSATDTITLAAPAAPKEGGWGANKAIAAIVVSTSVSDFDAPYSWTLPAGLPDCQISILDEGATAAAAPGADTTFSIEIEGVGVGSATIAAGQLTGTFTLAGDELVLLGEVTSLVAPANLNGMAGRLVFSIKGVR